MNIFAEKTVLTVTRLTALLRGVIEENFEQVWVEGEVSNLSFPSSGHVYFTLKDSGAQLRAVLFKSAAKNLKFQLKDGMALILRGRLSLYDQRGEYQIIVEYAEPAGIGALQLAFTQLKERLSREGLFDKEHKLPLPDFPQTVAVITSPTGAAIHDIINIIKRRFAPLQLLIYPVRVQGEGASLEISTAIDEINRLKMADLLIVGRGGGSLEDLWAFNEEPVALAIYRSTIPIISAVGHETDWSISDFVADLRAPTPSAAAELVIQSRSQLKAEVEQLRHRLVLSMEFQLKELGSRQRSLQRMITDPSIMLGHLAQRIDDLSERLKLAGIRAIEKRYEQLQRLKSEFIYANPAVTIEQQRLTVELCEKKLEELLTETFDMARNRCQVATAQLDVLSPLKTLARGYAIAATHKGIVVTDAAQLNSGDALLLTLHKGTVSCSVL